MLPLYSELTNTLNKNYIGYTCQTLWLNKLLQDNHLKKEDLNAQILITTGKS